MRPVKLTTKVFGTHSFPRRLVPLSVSLSKTQTYEHYVKLPDETLQILTIDTRTDNSYSSLK